MVTLFILNILQSRNQTIIELNVLIIIFMDDAIENTFGKKICKLRATEFISDSFLLSVFSQV